MMIFDFYLYMMMKSTCIYLAVLNMNNRNQLIKVFSSLFQISEVYSTESMYIGNKIEYTGLIKRDAGLFTMWIARKFTLRVGETQRAELAISKNQNTIEEVLSLHKLKFTKKCTTIDNLPCFGVVLENGKKYLLSLKNVHECQKFHAEISQIKKMQKQFISLFNSRRQASVINNQKNQQSQFRQKSKKQSNQIVETNQETDEFSESEESERINRRYRKRQFRTSSIESNEQSIFQTNLCEVATSVADEKEDSMIEQIESFFDKNQNCLLNSNFGLTAYPSPDRQKILINHENTAKSTYILTTSASMHCCIKYFLSFSSWNQQVKKQHTLNETQTGEILYLEFIKSSATTQSRCVLGEVNLLENDYCAAIRVRSIKRASYEYLSQKKEIWMELLVKMVTDRSNKMQKVMTVALSIKPSKEEFELAIKFLRAIKEFQQDCKKLI